MDVHEKLDIIIESLKRLEADRENLDDRLELLAEAVSDLGKPGSGYSVFDPEE